MNKLYLMIDCFRSQIYELALCDFSNFVSLFKFRGGKGLLPHPQQQQVRGGADVIISSMTEFVDWRTIN